MGYHCELNLNLIQNIRVVHALKEAGIDIIIDKKDVSKFLNLSSMVNIEQLKTTPELSKKLPIDISHDAPHVKILSINKPLLFPAAIFEYMRKNWASHREIDYTFTGLMTTDRKVSIRDWLKYNSYYKNPVSFNLISILQRLPLRLRKFLLKRVLIKQGPVVIFDSVLGRTFPEKSLDVDYFNSMLNAKFVLCPSGDFIWTYRFFEAIMCGSIPIIEEECALYKGFKYFKFNDDKSKYLWSIEDALFNYNLCLKMLTLSESESEKLKVDLGKLAD